jgi:hypothetical protein
MCIRYTVALTLNYYILSGSDDNYCHGGCPSTSMVVLVLAQLEDRSAISQFRVSHKLPIVSASLTVNTDRFLNSKIVYAC